MTTATAAFEFDSADTLDAPAVTPLPLALLLNPGLVQASLAKMGADSRRRLCRPLDRRFKSFLSKDLAAFDAAIDAEADEDFADDADDIIAIDRALEPLGPRLEAL
jgi:hypothetical protein